MGDEDDEDEDSFVCMAVMLLKDCGKAWGSRHYLAIASMSGLFMAFLELHCKLYKTVIYHLSIIYHHLLQQSALEREAKAIHAQKS